MPPVRIRSLSRPALVWLLALSASPGGCRPSPIAHTRYIPQRRNITITTVPLLSKELTAAYPFLVEDFAQAGVLAGKEIYAFVPSTITVVAGDTLYLEFVNPEDDAHAFVLPDLAVPLPGQSVTHATYVARQAGIFRFSCSVVAHLPMMSGQLVVLVPEAVTEAARVPGTMRP